jgi:iron complex transport system permease protein
MKFRTSLVLLTFILVFTIFISVSIGTVNVSLGNVWKIIISKIGGLYTHEDWNSSLVIIIWETRLPRVLLSGLVGASLSVVGVILQAIVRNPLADPQLLGVSSGASVGAVLSLSFNISYLAGTVSTYVAAFIGGLVSFTIVLLIAGSKGKFSSYKMILSGIAVSYFCSAITSFLVLSASNIQDVKSIQFWLLGGMSGASWNFLILPSVIVLLCCFILLLQSGKLNALLLGDDTAITLGVDVKKFRLLLIITSAIITAICVSLSGMIGFVGLMIPHLVRIFVGATHKKVLPLSFLSGAIFLIVADLLSRIIVAPAEMPVGVITAFIGGPFFIWLMISRPIQ